MTPRRYLLDTGPAQDYLFDRRGVPGRVKRARSAGAKVGTCTPALGEVVAGLEGSDTKEENWAIARRRLGKLVCWPYDTAAAYEFGRLIAELRRLGRPMQQVDIQVAAIARTLGNCVVVSSDTDLSAVPGLVVENWATG
ncbi:MAG: type II toxin-antitoxin system VapC family toxin [Gemmataceae bacterium]|nr:type II toxin-antitoxin system VapC family toxin [Gemmataceae bacterium]